MTALKSILFGTALDYWPPSAQMPPTFHLRLLLRSKFHCRLSRGPVLISVLLPVTQMASTLSTISPVHFWAILVFQMIKAGALLRAAHLESIGRRGAWFTD